jgi:hypothetical protein
MAIPLAAVAAFFIAALIWIGNDKSAGEHAFDDYSIENTSDSGLSLAFAYLQRTGHRVSRLDQALRAGLIPRDAVLIRAGSLLAPPDDEAEDKRPRLSKPLLDAADDEFVRGGGRLVLATDTNVGPLKVTMGKLTDKTAKKVFPIWPDVGAIPLQQPRAIMISTLPPRMLALFTADGEPVIARETIGAGELIVMAIPEVLQNQQFGRGRTLPLLLALAGKKRPVYFDESIHGFDSTDGPVALMKEWGLGPFLFMIAVAALAIFWRRATRVGPAEDDYRDTRSDAVDLVRSLGALYQSATTDRESIAMYREALVRSVAVQTGLRGDALNRRVAQLLGGHDKELDAINRAFRTLAGGIHANHR